MRRKGKRMKTRRKRTVMGTMKMRRGMMNLRMIPSLNQLHWQRRITRELSDLLILMTKKEQMQLTVMMCTFNYPVFIF
jgi:hypothetical protein